MFSSIVLGSFCDCVQELFHDIYTSRRRSKYDTAQDNIGSKTKMIARQQKVTYIWKGNNAYATQVLVSLSVVLSIVYAVFFLDTHITD